MISSSRYWTGAGGEAEDRALRQDRDRESESRKRRRRHEGAILARLGAHERDAEGDLILTRHRGCSRRTFFYGLTHVD